MKKQNKDNFRQQKRELQQGSKPPAQEEIIRFRLDRQTTLSAYAIAASRQIPLARLIRGWVIEHVADEGTALNFFKLKFAKISLYNLQTCAVAQVN